MSKAKEETIITDNDIESFIRKMMKADPVKFVQYCLIVIGKDIIKTNADHFVYGTEANLEDNRRFQIAIKGTIKEL